jgi:hypothetical protein
LHSIGPTQAPSQTITKVGEDAVVAALGSLTTFERRRGAVISADEQPVLVGTFLLQEVGESRSNYSYWTHLKRGFDWDRTVLAGGIAGFAVFIYMVARALGWVIDGFVTQRNS